MTTLKVNAITNAAGSGAPNVPDGVTIAGTALASINSMDYTASASEPATPKDGAIWWDTVNDKFFQYMDYVWIEVSYTNLPVPFIGETGVFTGGFTNSFSNIIDYIIVATAGNATDFGDLTISRQQPAACSDRTRGVIAGGQRSNSPLYTNTIDYITFATAGNAVDFGDLTFSTGIAAMAGCSDGTYGLFGGGRRSNKNFLSPIEYITIATAGNSTVFGNLTLGRRSLASCASLSRGLFGGGVESIPVNIIDYVTIAAPSNATDFGDLTTVMEQHAACSDSSRGIFVGNHTTTLSRIDYVTIATTGNATDFGDTTQARLGLGACANDTRAVFGGGYNQTGFAGFNIIDYITIATPGNATDFGDLTVTRSGLAACSGD